MSLKPQFIFSMILVMVITVAPIRAHQDSAKKEDEDKSRKERTRKALAVIDEIIRDAESLRLPENRLRVLIQTANVVWPLDEKRARLLFKNAQAALTELQSTIDNGDERNSPLSGLALQLRSEMLWMLGQRDPELALE